MHKIKNIISCVVLSVLIASMCSCGNANKSDNYAAIYGAAIGGLEDDELFAIIETNADLPVLLVTFQIYDDGL